MARKKEKKQRTVVHGAKGALAGKVIGRPPPGTPPCAICNDEVDSILDPLISKVSKVPSVDGHGSALYQSWVGHRICRRTQCFKKQYQPESKQAKKEQFEAQAEQEVKGAKISIDLCSKVLSICSIDGVFTNPLQISCTVLVKDDEDVDDGDGDEDVDDEDDAPEATRVKLVADVQSIALMEKKLQEQLQTMLKAWGVSLAHTIKPIVSGAAIAEVSARLEAGKKGSAKKEKAEKADNTAPPPSPSAEAPSGRPKRAASHGAGTSSEEPAQKKRRST